MNRFDAILFDMDGTLVPMEEQQFVKGYFSELAAVLCPYGLTPDQLVSSLWAGVGAMVQNDGSRTNEEVFWQVFAARAPEVDLEAVKAESAAFYSGRFHNARAYTRENPLAVHAVALARQKADRVVLATNPLFPANGQATRMSWVGLAPEDFDLVTSYENERLCKPNPAYYRSICQRLGLQPQRCLMIGNDENEDMAAATAAGLQGWLVTDCLIPCAERPWQGARGTFAQMVEYLERL